ncbi:MAG: outer membrane beta-barrel protein [Candidatus Omnitrophica bacterium]|nr:outer membrane beta-barrel protein [Candidatus Omnitrophota bacterium]
MRKGIVGLVAVSFIVFALSVRAYAEGENPLKNRVGLGGYGNMAAQRLSNFDTGFGGGGYLRYMPLDYIALESSFDAQVWDFSTSVSGASGTISGDFTVMPLSFTAAFAYPTMEGKLYYYAGGGIDYVFIDGSAKGTLSPGGAATVEYDNTFGGHISGGIDWLFANNWALNFDMKYTWISPDVSTTVQTGTLTVTDDEFDNLAMRIGVAYYF